MQLAEFIRAVRILDERQPITDDFECRKDTSRHRFTSQKHHLVGWAAGYGGPGAYGRKSVGLEAKHLYNHMHCPPALVYLAEALGEASDVVRDAVAAANSADANLSSQSAAVRKIIPWERIEELIRSQTNQPSAMSRIYGKPWIPNGSV